MIVNIADKIVMKEHKQELINLETGFEKELEKNKLKETLMEMDIKEKERYLQELEQEKELYQTNKMFLENTLNRTSESHKEEKKLRQRFEIKLNSVFSINRELRNRVHSSFIYSMKVR